jgi:prefoldin subunit 5
MAIGTPKSNQQLTNELRVLRTQYEALLVEIGNLKLLIDTKPKLSDITRTENSLNSKISDNAGEIVSIQRQLALVILPDDPRYYLTQEEVSSFQSNLSKLLAMMTSFEQLYKNLVAYSANLE